MICMLEIQWSIFIPYFTWPNNRIWHWHPLLLETFYIWLQNLLDEWDFGKKTSIGQKDYIMIYYAAFESNINILSWIIHSLDLQFFSYLDILG